MPLDKTINFGKVEVSTGYDASATNIVLKTGDGAKLPATGNFNMVWWNFTDYPDPIDDPNREIVRVTARSTDTLTITRGQESTSASTKNTSGKTYNMILGITSKMITDIDAGLLPTSTGGQLLYGGAGGAWSALNIGTANQVLKVNSGATAPEWGTVSGGQTLYEAVVAPSGGDYTTLGAALTAGKTRIFIRNGTYTESAITNSTAGIFIIGESRDGVVLNFSSNAAVFSGANVIIKNVYFSFTTAGLEVTGNDSIVEECKIVRSGTSASSRLLNFTSTRGQFIKNYYNDTVTTHSTTTRPFLGGTNSRHTNNYIEIAAPTGSNWGLQLNGARSVIANNTFVITDTGNSTLPALNFGGTAQVLSNMFFSSSLTGIGISSSAYEFVGNYVDLGTGSVAQPVQISGNITGNYFNNCDVPLKISDRSVIDGNTFASGGTSGKYYITIPGSTRGTVITGNRFYTSSSGQGAVDITSTSFTDGIIIKNNSFDNTMDGLWFSSGVKNAIVDIDQPALPELWQKRIRRMKNTSGGSLADGDVVVLKNVAGADEITTTTTANDDKVYGVVAEAISSNAWGWIQTRGQKAVVKVDASGTSVAIGDYLTTHTTAKKAVKATTGQTAFAIALAAASTDTTILCLLIEPRQIN